MMQSCLEESIIWFKKMSCFIPDEDASREIVRKAVHAVGSISDTEFNVAFNPDVYQPLVQHADEEVKT